MAKSNNILPDINENFSEWYNEVIFKAELIDQAPTRGCIIMRPYSYLLWEKMQQILDCGIKKMGAENAAFPLLIPSSFIEAEKDHVKGFAPEIAVVTHAGGKEIEEALVVRPTSEVVIHSMFSRWIKSWRDLPCKVNQWCNVIRWEKRPRAFIRTTEFWWQEGHTAHESSQEAYDQAYEAGKLYQNFFREYLGIPVISGEKPAHERFPGAQATFTFEAMMKDKKALQLGTVHVLGGGFAESFDIKFQDKNGNLKRPTLTSWGVTTRMIGAVIMVHGDEKGLVFPPKIAPIQFIILPIINNKNSEEENKKILEKCNEIKLTLENKKYSAKVDNSEETVGVKFNKWELKGVPFRIEIGKVELETKNFVLFERDIKSKKNINFDFINSDEKIDILINAFHERMFKKAEEFLKANTSEGILLSDFSEEINKKNGFFKAYWCGCEEEKFKEAGVSVRCLMKNGTKEKKICCLHGNNCIESARTLVEVIVGKAY
jgi:prolyl-tRNA synthetase